MEWYFAVYAVGMLSACVIGSVLLADGFKDERRTGARLVLTCWAWPVWLIRGVFLGAVYLFRESGWLRR